MATVIGVAEIECEGKEVPMSPAPIWEVMLVGGNVSSGAAKGGGEGDVELVVEVFKTGFLRGGGCQAGVAWPLLDVEGLQPRGPQGGMGVKADSCMGV